jgi:hypothetical protein
MDATETSYERDDIAPPRTDARVAVQQAGSPGYSDAYALPQKVTSSLAFIAFIMTTITITMI